MPLSAWRSAHRVVDMALAAYYWPALGPTPIKSVLHNGAGLMGLAANTACCCDGGYVCCDCSVLASAWALQLPLFYSITGNVISTPISGACDMVRLSNEYDQDECAVWEATPSETHCTWDEVCGINLSRLKIACNSDWSQVRMGAMISNMGCNPVSNSPLVTNCNYYRYPDEINCDVVNNTFYARWRWDLFPTMPGGCDTCVDYFEVEVWWPE